MSQSPMNVDEVDRKILNIIQAGFPIDARPYRYVGDRLGISEDEVIGRVKAMKSSGIIRRIGGSFDSKKLGFVSTLCAAKVPEERVEAFNEVINAYSGVTHNYTRNNDYNIWFTFIGETEEEIDRMLRQVALKTGVRHIMSLPARRVFKIKVKFEL
jgi:DNA-binding Lrp family transcriptional regulator